VIDFLFYSIFGSAEPRDRNAKRKRCSTTNQSNQQWRQEMTRRIIFSSLVSIMVLALIIWAISCAVNPVTGKREFMLLTESDEIALGQQTDQEVIQT